MADKCEVCGNRGEVVKTGLFAGSYGEVDYCKFCYANLCDDCMENGHCSDSPNSKHEIYVEDEDEE